MDYEKVLRELRQDYVNRSQQEAEGSPKKHTYNQIVQWIDQNANTTPPLQRAFMTQMGLASLAQVIDPPEMRPLVEEAYELLEKRANLSPISH